MGALSLTSVHLDAKEAGEEAPAYRSWEDIYRNKWRWDKVVKGTCNRADCIAACSLNLFIKDGIVWREEQNPLYTQTNPSLPDFNPRGCNKGVCYSDMMYDPSRVKYPMKRVGERGSGRWQRLTWEEALDEISDKLLDVCLEDGPESITYDFGTTNLDFGPGTPAEFRLTQLVGTTSLDEWASVGDLPMGAIQTWGLFNADGTSDDWFNSDYIIVWLGNPAYTRIPDVHFMLEARYKGAKLVCIAPDYSATAMHADLWLNPQVGTDAALALGMCQVIVSEGLHRPDFIKEQTDLPFLVREDTKRFLRQCDLEEDGQDDIFYLWDSGTGKPVVAPGSWGHSEATIRLDGIDPALEGAFEVTLAGGRQVPVRPVFELLKERLSNFTPEKASQITGVHAETIVRVARDVAAANAALVFASWGACKHYHMDLNQRAIILLLALTGHTGKAGGGMRIGAWWGVNLSYDRAAIEAFGMPAERAKVRDVEKSLRSLTRLMGSSPTMVWLYAHDEGYRKVVNEDAYHDPMLPRPVAEYAREAIDKDWMPIWPKGGKKPRVFLYTGMNPLRRWPVPHIIRENLWSQFELIVNWDFRMSTSGLYSDFILPAAGWHEKAGIKFTQSLVPYVCVGDKAVEPMFDSKSEWDIMAALAARIQQRANDREVGQYVDAFGVSHEPSTIYDDWSINGEFGEGKDGEALDVSISTSLPTKDLTWEEMAKQGAVRIKHTGPYGHITATCSDLQPDEALHPFEWFVTGKEPWPTLTGRQQFYLDHPWYMEVAEELPTYKDPPKAGGNYPLWFSGGHTRWSIHAIWRTSKILLNLQRGEPVMYMNPQDAQARGLQDHDIAWVYNDVGGFKIHVKASAAVQPGQVIVYHAWEPYQFADWMGSQAVVASPWKPLHLLGDYGHLTWRTILGQPSHIMRAMAVEVEKARPA